jgi:hypothetical protein
MKRSGNHRQGSELRTRAGQEHPGDKDSAREQQLSAELKIAWAEYLSKVTQYRASRARLGRILSELQGLLAQKGRFKRYLRERRLPPATVYDILRDHKQLGHRGLPEIVTQVAEAEGIDLGRKGLSEALTKFEPELKEVETTEEAKELLNKVLDAGKRKAIVPDESLSKRDRQVFRVRLAIRKSLAKVPPRDKRAILMEGLDQETHSLGIEGFVVTPKKGDLTVDGRKRRPSSLGPADASEEGVA